MSKGECRDAKLKGPGVKKRECPAISLELSNDASHTVPEREDKNKNKGGDAKLCVYITPGLALSWKMHVRE